MTAVKIKNLMDELRERNPFLTAEIFREFKHYHSLNEENYHKLIGFIKTAIKFMEGFRENAMHGSERRYEVLDGLPTYGPMYVQVSGSGEPFYSAGFVVRFYKSDGSEWIANFKPAGLVLV